MKSLMSNLVKNILDNPQKAKVFTAAVLRANQSGQPVTVINDGKKYKIVRATASPK